MACRSDEKSLAGSSGACKPWPKATSPNAPAELARDADLRLNPPQRQTTAATATPEPVRIPAPVDPRLPPPGTILARPYKGQLVQVQVLTDGFAYAGRVYPSLSAVAKAVTGTHTNGYLFFRNTLNHNKETA